MPLYVDMSVGVRYRVGMVGQGVDQNPVTAVGVGRDHNGSVLCSARLASVRGVVTRSVGVRSSR